MKQIASNLNWLFDFEQFAPACLKLYDTDSHFVPFKLAPLQQRIHRERGRRTLILKARQVMASTYVVGKWYHDCVTREGTRAVTVAHRRDATTQLFSRVRTMHKNMPIPVPTEIESQSEIKFADLGSTYYIGTAGSRSFGRSDTLHRIHLSEVDFWESRDVLTGILAAASATSEIIMETTPNGFGVAYDFIERIKTGDLPEWTYINYFWYEMKNYRAAQAVPPSEWTEDERTLSQKALLKGVKLDGYQVAWRRNKIAEYKDGVGRSLFFQEFPEDDISCFLSSGSPRFDNEHLNALIAQCKPAPEQKVMGDGMTLRVWEPPQADKYYIIGADSAEGKAAGDNNAACIIDWQTGNKVADLWGKCELFSYAELLIMVAKRYRDALIVPEINNTGYAVVETLKRLGYPNIYRRLNTDGIETGDVGWMTDSYTRPTMIDALANFYGNATATQCPDQDEIREAMSFVIGKNNKSGADEGKHDDKVMARGIALMARQTFRPPPTAIRRAIHAERRQI